MEKYRQFGDGQTGVHPFVPLWSHHQSSILVKLLKVVLFPIVVLRLLLFAVAVLLIAVAELLGMFCPIGLLRYPIYRLFTYLGCSVALLALGIISSSDELADHRRLKLPPPKTSAAKIFDCRRGSLIIVNHVGITDVLLLGLKVCPVFVFPAADGTPVRFSLLAALRRAGSCNKEVAPTTATLADISAKAKSSWQPVVVFPEGTRTVGNSVLAWKDNTFEGLTSFGETPARPLVDDTSILSIRYNKSGYAYTPHHTVGSSFWHIFWLCYQLPHFASTVWLSSSDVAPALKGKTIGEQVARLRALLTMMVPSAVEVSIGAETHLDFMAFWNDAQRKGYTQKKNKKS